MLDRSLLGNIFFSVMIMLFITQSSYGQEIKSSDSIPDPDNTILLSSPIPDLYTGSEYKTIQNSLPYDLNILNSRNEYQPGYYPGFYTDKSPAHKGDYHVSGTLKDFRQGMIYGSGRQESLPGVGTVNYAGIGYRHYLSDNISLNIQLHAMKGNMPYSRSQSFGTSGNFIYQLNDRITLNAFGSYFITPSSSFKTYNYGASMYFNVTERFGMDVGVRRYYDPFYRKWETIPIITPTYKFKKIDVGIDVGSLLHYAFSDWLK
ncbi:MAG: hypothetical protein LUH22_19655 [Bacteroides sp.]|nr:hypothetical protein [Bacteroides sp.]